MISTVKALLPGCIRRLANSYCPLLIFLVISSSSFGQTRDRLQQNNAPGYNYVSGAYRNLFYVPLDTLNTADSGAVAYKGGRFWIKGSAYWVDFGLRKVDDSTFVFGLDTLKVKQGSSKNFATDDLTLTGDRVHTFGMYGMRFTSETNFDPESEWIGLYDGLYNGLTISGNSDHPTSAGIRFLDAAAPGTQSGMVNFYGQQQWYSTQGGNTGNFMVGPGNVSLGNTNGIRNKQISSTLGERSLKGIRMLDDIDSTGMFYDHDYKDSGLAVHGDRWIPDAGWVKSRIPDDYMYLTDAETCHDTSFVNAAGIEILSYEYIVAPAQFKGHRLRVNAVGIHLYESELWGGGYWYYQWLKSDGILRIFSSSSCSEFGPLNQSRLLMAY